ncbi:hypothetical protein GCM10011613_32660 [Cellvibrio zantedeschiae]|uniref:Uncharacterized protein n=1 Tax=Cellvibrio zantedeschiae TaxID=1237077 RepID=A0ABQ3B9P9_9GAMM|nr:hypothetical protein [Cellvibrio zantedeschiae]GGY85030.1 hypothetical protein GCM10011613_32660 [Cellvibrio zantedeschiae]
MNKIAFISLLVGLTQFTFAQEVPAKRSQKIEGCIYGDIVYEVGAKHSVQQAVTDPVTHKTTMVDLEPKIVQECMEDKNADKTKSPRFYWRTLPN